MGAHVRRFAFVVVGVVVLISAMGLLPAAPDAAAGSTVVTNCLDDGSATTLRVAITSANTGDTITFTPGLNCSGANAIVLTGGTLMLSNNVTIDGTGATIAVDGGCTFSSGQCQAGTGVTVIRTDNSVTVTLNALTIQHGNGVNAGGIAGAFSDTITVTNCTITGNKADGGGVTIQSLSTLTVTNSTITGNTATDTGGGIFAAGTVTVTNSTLSGNAATNGGGGIYNAAGSTISLTNTIVATNTGGNLGGGPFSGNNNLIDDTSPIGGTGNITNASALLGTLGDNGGPTQTIPLLSGSPAINAGAAVGGNVPATDQRGVHRPQGAGVDIGAFEVAPYTMVVNNAGDGIADIARCAALNANTCRLRDAIAAVNGGVASGTTTTFASDMTIMLKQTVGTLTVSHNMTIDGTGHAVVVDGNNVVRVFFVTSGFTVTINHLTIQHGNATSGGGAILNQGTLTVSDSTITANTSNADAGGGINSTGTVRLIRSTMTNNTGDIGGAIFNDNGTVVATDSTITGNHATITNGGALGNAGPLANATLTNCTLTGNTAVGVGGGISSSNTLTLKNTIVAGNSATTSDPDIHIELSTMTGSNNLIGDGTGVIGITNGTSGNQIGTAASPITPLLGPLGTYGSANGTQTLPLLPGSPAIDAGTSTGAPATDQRGISRPQGGGVDIGAFESKGFTLTPAAGSTPQSTLVGTPFALLTVSVTANGAGEPVAGGQITFTAPTTGASIQTSPLTAPILAGGTAGVMGTANFIAGSYAVTASTTGAPSVPFALTNLPPTITLSPTTLPAGVKGIAYPTTTLTASGTGTAPYAFTVIAGTLTPGLTLNPNGTLSGTPTATGPFTFTVTATDAHSFTGTQQYSITVTAAPLVSIAVTPANGTLKVGGTQQFTATGMYADNSTADITNQVTWGSDNSAVAKPDGVKPGEVIAMAPGSAHVTATQGAVTGQTGVTVSGGTVVGIAPAPQTGSRPAGTTGEPGATPAPEPGGTGRGGTGSGTAPTPAPSGR